MGRPKNSTRARRNNVAKAAKAASYRRHRVLEEARAPGEARNGENLSEVIEENPSCIDNQEEWSDNGEGVGATSNDSSSVVCLDQDDEGDIGRQETANLNMVLFKGFANWQKSVTEKLASTKRPRFYSGHSPSTIYRGKAAGRKNGQTLDDLWGPTVSPKIRG
jgi:hypothetical protein